VYWARHTWPTLSSRARHHQEGDRIPSSISIFSINYYQLFYHKQQITNECTKEICNRSLIRHPAIKISCIAYIAEIRFTPPHRRKRLPRRPITAISSTVKPKLLYRHACEKQICSTYHYSHHHLYSLSGITDSAFIVAAAIIKDELQVHRWPLRRCSTLLVLYSSWTHVHIL